MKIQLENEWHTILGQGPTPRGLHQMYIENDRVGRIHEAYEGEVESMYSVNGYSMEEFMLMPVGVSPRIVRHCFEKVSTQRDAGMLLGPAVVRQELWQGSLALWVPNNRR